MIYYFIVIYLMVVIFYFEKNRTNRLNNISLFILSLCIPIVGFIISIIYNMNNNNLSNITYEFEEMRDDNLDKLDKFLLKSNNSNFYSELILNNYQKARKSIVDFNKLSVNEKSILYMNALYSDDTEVSHMAAASLMKIKQQYENELKLDNNTNSSYLEEYVFKLEEYVSNNLIKGVIKDNLIINCVNNTEKYINLKSINLNYFISYIKLLLEINRMDLAKRYAYHVKDTWFNNEKSWYCLFNVLLKEKNKKELLNVIKEYKKNKFEFSNNINSFMDFWEDSYEENK